DAGSFDCAGFTIEGWIRDPSGPHTLNPWTGVVVILDKRTLDNTGAVRGYQLSLYNGNLLFQLANGITSKNYYLTTSKRIDDGAWHHIAVVMQYHGSNWIGTSCPEFGTLYDNGQPITQFTT